MNKCKGCKHWKNEQRLLNYSSFDGFCTNSACSFNTVNGRSVGVVDMGNLKNRSEVLGNPSHDFECIKTTTVSSRYLLQTNEEFGCILFEDLK